MEDKRSAKYTLLGQHERELENGAGESEAKISKQRLWSAGGRQRWSRLIECTVVLSLLANVVLITMVTYLRGSSFQCKSRYTGLSLDVDTAYERQKSPYVDQTNLSQTDALWDAFDTSPNAVALTDDWVRRHNIPVSPARFPWDESKGIYHVKAYHHLHCLNLYKTVSEGYHGVPQTVSFTHLLHCLDALRQDVMCFADDTPMPTGSAPNEIGHGQVRYCKNLDHLREWTQQPERNACFRKLSDYRQIRHTLEEFAFCPEDSPYYNMSREYFEIYGHKDPFEGY